MLIQFLAVVGALYLISSLVAGVALAVYFTLQHLKHEPGVPGPFILSASGSHFRPPGKPGCNPVDQLLWALVLVVFIFSVTVGFFVGALYTLLVTNRAIRYYQERGVWGIVRDVSIGNVEQRDVEPFEDPVQITPPSYGAC